MSEVYEDPLARLEAVLLDWDYAFHESRQRVSSRLLKAKSRLEVAWSDAEDAKAAMDAVSGAAAASPLSLEHSHETPASSVVQDQVRGLEQSLERSYARIQDLEQDRTELLLELDVHKKAKAALVARQRGLENEMAALRERLEAALVALDAAPAPPEAPPVIAEPREAITGDDRARLQARLVEIQEESDRSNASLGRRLAEALRDRDEAHRQIVELRLEAESLRNAAQVASAQAFDARAGLTTLDFNESDMKRLRLGQILETRGIVTPTQLDQALDAKKKSPNRPLGAILVDLGFTDEETIGKVLASQFNLPYVELDRRAIDPAAATLIPAKLARHHLCIPIAVERGQLVVAMANPMDLIALEDLELATRRRVDPVIATPTAIENAIAQYYTSI